MGVVDVSKSPGDTFYLCLVRGLFSRSAGGALRSSEALEGGLSWSLYVWQKLSKCLLRVFDTKDISREAALLGMTIKDGYPDMLLGGKKG